MTEDNNVHYIFRSQSHLISVLIDVIIIRQTITLKYLEITETELNYQNKKKPLVQQE